MGGVQASGGQRSAPGVDGQTVDEFEEDLKGNLYKIWNRMSSGSYFPPPVRAVEIPKPHGGGVRVLGVPTVADRVAQTVVANVPGGPCGTPVSTPTLWLSSPTVRPRCGRSVPGAVLEEELGHRPRCRQSSSTRCRGTS